MPTKKLTDADKNDIYESITMGEKVRKVAGRFDVTPRYVKKIVKDIEDKFKRRHGITWDRDQPRVIRAWLAKVYAEGVDIDGNGFDSEYARGKKAYYENLNDNTILSQWQDALMDAYFAFAEDYEKDEGKERARATYERMLKNCHGETRGDYWALMGVTVCDRWRTAFENFYKDMGPRPEDYQIHRIDDSRGYELSNCQWKKREMIRDFLEF